MPTHGFYFGRSSPPPLQKIPPKWRYTKEKIIYIFRKLQYIYIYIKMNFSIFINNNYISHKSKKKIITCNYISHNIKNLKVQGDIRRISHLNECSGKLKKTILERISKYLKRQFWTEFKIIKKSQIKNWVKISFKYIK